MLQIDALFFKLQEAQKNEMPFVIYSYPKSNRIQLWIQNSKDLIVNAEFDEEGFVFAPFNLDDGVVLFPGNCAVRYEAEIQDADLSAFQNPSNTVLNPSFNKDYHVSLVEFGIQFLNKADCRKVVLSREEQVEVADFDVVATYKRMLQKYENACVYLWSHPAIGTWMGASPERLLKVEGNQIETTSLAGTQVYSENLTWGKKELEEQQIVTDYIAEVLQHHIEAVKIEGPRTSKAGTLAHLKSIITGKLKKTSELKDIIGQLHPTPAVCGMPKKQSYDFLITNENYHRSFYTGFFGELSFQKPTNLYVNLRCMQYKNDKVSIYVGGGITAASNAEKEWEETVAKAKIMKAIL